MAAFMQHSFPVSPMIQLPAADGAAQRVLIVSMPLATPEFPGLGPTVIRSTLNRDGVPCDILYGNLVFSRIVKGDPWVERQLTKLATTEIIFSPYYFDTTHEAAASYLHDYLHELSVDPSRLTAERFHGLVDAAGQCLDEIFDTVRWEHYDIVGFSTMMQQTVASLALARRIKAHHPEIHIVFGGANAAKPMGEEMLRSFPEIDLVVDGEADAIVTPLVRQLRARPGEPPTVGGVLYRDADGGVQRTGDAAPFTDLDSLPFPDYEPFFAQLEANGIDHVQPYLQIETSRGCWWGQKHHCTFCGIDDLILTYRSKSNERVLDEILTLSEKHAYADFFTVDSIINLEFLRTLLPRLGELREEAGLDLSFFFESKSNLHREQMQIFRYGGVNSVQPGIESFSDHVLELMNKGSTGARQVQCLKLLAESNIIANWNLIYRNPGETAEDYRRQIDVIPYLHHLPPLHGEGLIPMLLNRYAPYHNTPEQFGITNIRPLEWYEQVFVQDGLDLDKLAFYFEYDHPTLDDEELAALHTRLNEAIDRWRECWRENALVQRRGPGFVEIEDRRRLPAADGTIEERDVAFVIEDVWAEVFTACDLVTTRAKLARQFDGRVDEAELEAFLDAVHAERLVYRSESGQIVNLPLLLESRDRFRRVPDDLETLRAPERSEPVPA